MMKKRTTTLAMLYLFGLGILQTKAQLASASDNLVAQPIPDRSVFFEYSGAGVSKPMIWGMDAGGWTSPLIWEVGKRFLGAENLKITRVPAFPGDILIDGQLTQGQKNAIRDRIDQAAISGNSMQIMLNPGGADDFDAWYRADWSRYALLMQRAKEYIGSLGHKVVSITVFNEPDVWYAPATEQDDYNLFQACRKNTALDGVRLCGGNTLNPDFALGWYNFCLPAGANEGNTHQLAGSFDSYASFYQAVKRNGHYATNDEVHDIMESIVGAEYGLQAGIYWGYANLARGEFVKACNGVRLGYAEHRPNWTAAAVYRKTGGQVQAFCGASERQATTTSYRYVSKDRDVYYEGYGPQREYTLVMPGGNGYQVNQPYAERVINISWGDDIQQPINGSYVLVNRNSGKVITIPLGYATNGLNINQMTYSASSKYQQWKITPVSSRIGGDFSYFSMTNAGTNKSPDVKDYSIDNGTNIQQWDTLNAGNQQWYFDYAGDGWFYIRSRHNTLCLQPANASTSSGASLVQWAKNESAAQQWRLIPAGAPVEFVAPGAPSGLVATPNAESVRLDWSASPESDVACYSVFRADKAGGPYNTIARNVKSTSFVDNTAISGQTYYYAIKAVDNSLNRSGNSNEASATPTGSNTIVTNLQFEGNTLDNSANLNHCAKYGAEAYTTGKTGSQAIALNGINAFVQLPATIATHNEMTIATWVYWKGGNAWQRIFDFGNGENEYMFLSPKSTTGQMRFAITAGGNMAEQGFNTTALPPSQWSHLAVTFGESGVSLYVNGSLVTQSGTITLRPSDFKPVLNYIGRSQWQSDALFNGNIDEFKVYNYALSGDDVAKLYSGTLAVDAIKTEKGLSIWPNPASHTIHVNYSGANHGVSTLSVMDTNGRLVNDKEMKDPNDTDLNVEGLPSGIYLLKLTNSEETLTRKFVVKH